MINALVTSYPTSLCVSWGPPEDNGGSPIDSYRLELRNSTGTAAQVVTTEGDAHFHSLESLITDTSYT